MAGLAGSNLRPAPTLRLMTSVATANLRLSFCPISKSVGRARQQVLMLQDPDTPWHLHWVTKLDSTACSKWQKLIVSQLITFHTFSEINLNTWICISNKVTVLRNRLPTRFLFLKLIVAQLIKKLPALHWTWNLVTAIFQLTACSRSFTGKLTVAHLQRNTSALWGPRLLSTLEAAKWQRLLKTAEHMRVVVTSTVRFWACNWESVS
jgi:hypothetical protein